MNIVFYPRSFTRKILVISNRNGFFCMTFVLTLLYCACDLLGYFEQHPGYWQSVQIGAAMGVAYALCNQAFMDFVSNVFTVVVLYVMAYLYIRLSPVMTGVAIWLPALLMTSAILTARYFFFDHFIGRMHSAIRNTTLLMEKESQ